MILKFNEYNIYTKNKYTSEDIIECIEKNGYILSDIVEDTPDLDKNIPIKPVSIDEYDNISVYYDGHIKTVRLKDVKNIIY
jgi:hypothetical protein